MSNETASDKKQPAKDPSLTRIPVRWMRFKDNFDIPANPSQSNLKGYALPEGNPKWYSIAFIPAWQMFEVTLMNGAEPVVMEQPEFIPASMVYKWHRG